MSYHTYKPLIMQLERMSWRAGILKCKKKERGDKSLQETVHFIITEQPQMYKTIDLPILMEEWLWLNNKQVVFPESEQLVKRLLKASARIKRPEKLFKDDTDSFILALPKSFAIQKTASTGILVTLMPWKHRQQLTDDFFHWLHLASPLNASNAEELSVCITYQMPNIHKEIRYRAIIPISWMNDLLNAKNGHEYGEILGNFDDKKNIGAIGLSDEEASYQQVIVKLILAVLLYKKTNPEQIKPGFPTKNRQKFETTVVKKQRDFTLSSFHNAHSSPSDHYRSWYFKQLFADRFYQGQYSHLTPGSRVIFVNETWVNQKIEPKTLVGK